MPAGTMSRNRFTSTGACLQVPNTRHHIPTRTGVKHQAQQHTHDEKRGRTAQGLWCACVCVSVCSMRLCLHACLCACAKRTASHRPSQDAQGPVAQVQEVVEQGGTLTAHHKRHLWREHEGGPLPAAVKHTPVTHTHRHTPAPQARTALIFRAAQGHASRCRQVQAGAGRCRQVQADAGRCKQVQAGADIHRLLKVRSSPTFGSQTGT